MKDKIITITFVSFLSIFLIINIFTKDKEVSREERRTLASSPRLEIKEIIKGDNSYFNELNTYFLDQFSYRSTFRKIKGTIATRLLQKKENNGVFETEGHLVKVDSKINYSSLDNITSKINYINEKYLDETNHKYFAFIPDKNYYIKNKTLPKLDYNELETKLKSELNYLKWIDLKEELSLSNYYSTDIHWKQETLSKVVNRLEKEMNLKITKMPEEKSSYYPFYGALYSSTASNVEKDIIYYLKNDIINNVLVYNYEKNKYEKVYNEENLKHIDSYDIYLSGATALLTIENKAAPIQKELIMFRDSFSSSLAPLLIENYSKITLIDLRYISSKYLEKVDINFKNADVLFIYSMPIINNSFSLK